MTGAREPRIAVRLTPRAAVDRIDGVERGILRVRVSAPPVEGAANEALVRLLATTLDVPRSRVRLVRGVAGRVKVVELDGLDPATLRARWPDLGV